MIKPCSLHVKTTPDLELKNGLENTIAFCNFSVRGKRLQQLFSRPDILILVVIEDETLDIKEKRVVW